MPRSTHHQAKPAPDPAVVLSKATLRAASLLGLTHAALADIVGLSPSQISRIARLEKTFEIGSKSAELATLLVRVYRSLDALVGNDETARKVWMQSHNIALNQTPLDAIKTVAGLVYTLNYLDGARAQL